MKKVIVIFLMTVSCILSCKKWDDHIALDSASLGKTIYEQMSENSDLSLFVSYVDKMNLDTLLNSSRNLTVFAPDNEAFANLPDSVKSNDAAIRRFLLNLIALKSYYIRDQTDTSRILMMSGKRVLFANNQFGDADFASSDNVARNGVFHVLKEVVLPLPNIWEFINATKETYKQNAYVASLNYEGQDISQAEIDSIDLETGEPVYKSGTGIVQINTFKQKVCDVGNEDSLFTYIVLTDAAFGQAEATLKPFFKANSEDTVIFNADWYTSKDMVFSGLYDNINSQQTLVSKFGVHYNLIPSTIVSSYKVSNGIVYVVNAAETSLQEKIPVVYIQGENPIGFSSETESALEDIFYRKRYNPITKDTFNDIYVNRGSSGANFYVDYSTNNLLSTTYKVYWVALNDYVVSGQGDDAYGTTANLNQIVQVLNNDSLSTVLFNETGVVEPYTYTETYIGEFVNDAYNWLLSYPDSMPDGSSYLSNPATKIIRLQAPSSNSSPYNLTLDYLKFVPVFN